MPALPSGIRAASPLNLDDGVRLLFTADTTETLSRALDNTPTDFQSMDSGLQVTVNYSQQGRADDTLGLSVRIVNGATILAAANAGGTFQTVNANVTNTTDTDTTPTFGFVNTSASKTTWDGATIELQQTYGQNMGKDGCLIRVDSIELVGNYTAATQQYQEDLSTTITATTTEADVAAFVEAFSGGDPVESFYEVWAVDFDTKPWNAAKWAVSQGPGGDASLVHSSGQGRLLTGSSATSDDDYARAIAEMPTSTDQEVLVRVHQPTSVFTPYRIWLRASGDWSGVFPTDGYAVEFGVFNPLFLIKQDGGSGGILNSANPPITTTDPYYIRFRVEGSTVSVKVWNTDDPEPGEWTLNETDTDVTGPGVLQVAYGPRNSGAAGTEPLDLDDLYVYDLGAAPASTALVTTDVLDRFPNTNRDQLMAELQPLAWWKLGDSAGTDEAGTHDLTWNGSPTFSPAAGDMPISGGMGYVTLDDTVPHYATAANDGDFELLEDMFVEVWVRPHTSDAGGDPQSTFLFYGRNDNPPDHVFGIAWDEVETRYEFSPASGGSAAVALPNADPEVNVWAHWVHQIVWGPDFRAVQAYWNGTRRLPNFDTHAAMTAVYDFFPIDDVYEFFIGRGWVTFDSDHPFDGDIAEIAIFAGKIRPSQARDLAASSYGMSETLQTSITATTTSADAQAMAETLSTSIVASTTSADALAATEALTVSVVATTTEADVLTFTDTLSTQIVATVTEADTAAFTETLSTTVVATTTSAETLAASETLSSSIVASTTSTDVLAVADALATSIVASTSVVDDLAMAEALTTSVVATTTAVDTFSGGQAYQEPLDTDIVATTTTTDTLAAAESLSTSVVATTTSADDLSLTETLATAVTATTATADVLTASDALSTSITASTTSTDVRHLFETLSTSITAAITAVDQLSSAEALTTSITATTTAADQITYGETLSTTIAATSTEADTAAFTETLATSIVASTQVIDQLQGAFVEMLSTDIVATTTAADQLTAVDSVTTNIVATVTSTDDLALFEALTTSGVATSTSSDQLTAVDAVTVNIISDVALVDGLVFTEALDSDIVATSTAADQITYGETLTTSGVVTTTSGDVASGAELLAVNIVATVTADDILTLGNFTETLQVGIVGSSTLVDQLHALETLVDHLAIATTIWDRYPWGAGVDGGTVDRGVAGVTTTAPKRGRTTDRGLRGSTRDLGSQGYTD